MATKYVVKPGDTLNSIAKQAGYSDYKSAGINSVPSGNFDLIRPGEEITLNGSTNVSQIKSGTPIVTSYDKANQFKDDATTLDGIVNAPKLEDRELGGDDPETKDIVETGDKDYDLYQKSAFDAKAKAKAEGVQVQREYDSLYKLELAAIDAKTRSTVKGLQSTFSQRINEQEKINKINVDRVKAYGLGGGAALYTPIEWSDAITERERKGADEIKSLEIQRQNLIDQAKAAKQEGNAKLLSQKMKDYQAAKDKLNNRLSEIEADSIKQYENLRTLRKERETEFKEKQQEALKRLQSYYKLNKDEVENLSDDEKEGLVNKLSGQYGFEPYEVLSVLEQAVLPDYDSLKAEAEIGAINARATASRASAGASNASAGAAWALTKKRNKETDILDSGGWTETEKKKLEAAGLTDASRDDQLKHLYPDDYTEDGGGSDTIEDDDPLGLGV